MSPGSIFFHFFVSSLIVMVDCQSCAFNSNCTCEGYTVVCTWDTPQFPVFTEFNTTSITTITIDVVYNGSQTLVIPPNAFLPLQSLLNYADLDFVHKKHNCTHSPKVTTSHGAFNTFGGTYFNQIQFKNIYFPTLANQSFYGVQVTVLDFQRSCIDVIEDYAFYGLTANAVKIQYAGNKTQFQQYSLVGINFSCCESQINILSTGLNGIQPFKLVTDVYQLVLNWNTLISISDFSFCTCNSLYQCNNTFLQSVNLQNNFIQYVSSNAFANLPAIYYIDLSNNKIQTISLANIVSHNDYYGYLSISNNILEDFSMVSSIYSFTNLDLSYNHFASVPTTGLQSISSSLTYLDLSYNNISRIGPNGFYNLTQLETLVLDYNPISTIEPGAFNGLTGMSFLTLSNLDKLRSVDLLITYGTNLQSLSIVADSLDFLYIADPSKLPKSLYKVGLYDINSLKQLDPILESWLKFRTTNVYYFSNITEFPCNDDIQWMSTYAVCSPTQILTMSTVCQDGTTLISYLQAFNPSC